MVEIMYLAEGNRIPVDFRTIKNKIIKSDNYHIIDLDMEIVETAKEIRELELHDQLIVATGEYLKIPILTCDRSIQESNAIRTIWADNL